MARIERETKPFTAARKKALSQVKWVLSNDAGNLWAAMDNSEIGGRVYLTPKIEDAVIFDMRDNEQIKCRFYSALLKTPMVVELI